MSFTGSPTARIVYHISALVRRCVEGIAPTYLRELFSHRDYSASGLVALFCASSVTGPPDYYPTAPRFPVGGPTAWNGLPVALRLTPVAYSFCFSLATLFGRDCAG